jgi:hypothetical protein
MSVTRGCFVTVSGILTASLALAQGGFNGPGRYEIMNLKSGKMLELDRNDQTTVVQFSARGTDNQRWDLTMAGSGFFFIRNLMSGKALEPSRNSNSAPLLCNRFDGKPNQQWRIQPGKDGNALIVSRAGRTIDIPDGTSRDGVKIQIYDLNGDSNQRFTFRRVEGGGFGDGDRGRGRGGIFEEPGGRNRQPDSTGRFWDDREQTWRLAGDGACFYQQPDFHGDAFCARSGAGIDEVPRDAMVWSVRLFGQAREVEVFERPGFRGGRARIARDTRDLGRLNVNGRIGSVRVN